MRESDLLCRAKRRWVMTTDSSHGWPVYRNLVKDIQITCINQVWLADITYIRIRHGFVYLAAILDAFSRKVIGYAVSGSMDTSLVLEALSMAIANRKPGAGVIHHSDRGVQYASIEYTKELNEQGTLKHEEVYLYEYETLSDIETRLPYFIEQVYNLKRLHSSLGYRSSVRYETLVQEQQYKEHLQLVSPY